jgi:hypothetical protein
MGHECMGLILLMGDVAADKLWYVPSFLRVVEWLFDLIELTSPAPIDQFFKYAISTDLFPPWIDAPGVG